MVVTSAAIDDAVAAPQVLAQSAIASYACLETVGADRKYHHHALSEWIAPEQELPKAPLGVDESCPATAPHDIMERRMVGRVMEG